MERINLCSGLTAYNQQYIALKNLFNQFQKNLLEFNNSNFPAENIAVDATSDLKATISFIDRSYELKFSSDVGAKGLNGVVKFVREFEDDAIPKELNIITFDSDGIAVIDDQGDTKNFMISNKATAGDKILELLILEINHATKI